MNYVKQEIAPKIDKNIKFTIVDSNDNDKGYFDLYLLSMCKHQILSNSSFGVIGALLNKNKDKIVIMPDKWIPLNDDFFKGSDFAFRFPGWIVINGM
jgi:hypothetical protein